jgi:hypothetical protein
MQLARIREGDEIKCNVRGRLFTAVVDEKLPGKLRITPTTPNVNHYHVTAHQVDSIVRKAPK